MRFAWIREQSPGSTSQPHRFPHPVVLLRLFHNLVFWFFLLPLFTPLSYRAGFIFFTMILAVRSSANLYHNNLMAQTPEAFDKTPLRIPV